MHVLSSPLTGLRIFKGSIWLWGQIILNMLLSLIFTWLILHYLPPHEFALVVMVQTVLNLGNLATFNLDIALPRFVPEYHNQGRWRTGRLAVILALASKVILGGLAAAGVIVCSSYLESFYQYDNLAQALRVGCISLFAAGLVQAGQAICLAYLRPEVRTVVNTIQRISEIILLAILISLWGLKPVWVVAVLSIGDAISAILYLAFWLRQTIREPVNVLEKPATLREILRQYLNYCLPLMGGRAADSVGQNLNKLIVGKLVNEQVFGYYGMAHVAIERFLPLLFQSPMMAVPVLAQEGIKTETETNRLIEKLMVYQWIIGVIGNLAIWAAAPLFVDIFGQADYYPAIPAMRILGFVLMFWSATASLHAIFMVNNHTTGNLIISLGQIVVSSGFYFILVRWWGASGAALADVIAYASGLVIAVWLAGRWFSFSARRIWTRLAAQTLGILFLVAPVWFLQMQRPGWLILWFGVAVAAWLSYALRDDLISEADLRLVFSQPWLPEGLEHVKSRILKGLLAYQENLKKYPQLKFKTPQE